MSTLIELLKGIPVEWKALGDESFVEIANNGRKPVKSELRTSGVIPYYGANNIQDYVEGFTHDGEYVLIAEDGTQSVENYSIQWAIGKFWANNHVHVVRGMKYLDSKFLYHYLKTVNFIPYLSGGGRAKLTKGNLINIPIPIPFPNDPQKSLAIQQEIVRVLDSLSEQNKALTTALAQEIENRKKQYEFFSQKLFNFKSIEFESRKLGTFCDFTYGFAAKAEDRGNVRFIRISDINNDGNLISEDKKYVSVNDENKRFLLEKNDILVARTGGTFGKTMIFNESYPAIYAGFLIKISFDRNVLDPKYYWHFAQNSEYWLQANKLVSGGGQPQFNANAVKEIKIPIPFPDDKERSILEQGRIVHLLDQFDSATKSIVAELEKEIALRNQQYKYYRDILLTFPTGNK